MYSTTAQWLVDELNRHGEVSPRPDGDIYYFSDGLLDSMSLLKFLVKIQKQFNVLFSPDQLINGDIASVYALASAIESHNSAGK